MTRNDFEIIAEVIASVRPDLPTEDMTDHGVDLIACAFADRLRLVNPRFNRTIFLNACGCDA